MATDTTTTTKPTDSPKAATPAKPAQAKRKPASRAKSAPKSRTRARTASKTRKPAARPAAAAAPRAQATAQNGGRQFVAGVIDVQEKTATAIADYQTRAAEASQIPGATAIASAQAQLLRSATDAYVSAARALLK